MLKNTFRLLFRNILRNKFSYSIGFLSLLTGITFSLVTCILALYETGYDGFHRDAERIYRINSDITIQGTQSRFATSPRLLGPTIDEQVPEVEDFTRLRRYESGVFDVDGKMIKEKNVVLGETNFFGFFTYNFKYGKSESFGRSGTIVLTEELSSKLFGNIDPVDKNLLFLGKFPLIVTGVIADPPGNSHLRFNALIAASSFNFKDAWDEIDVYTYLKVKPNVSMNELAAKLDALSKDYISLVTKEYNADLKMELMPLRDIHLSSDLNDELAPPGSMAYVYILFCIAVFLLIIGAASYININIVIYIRRMKEVALKRVFGASRTTITLQFVIEFIGISGFCLLIAIGIVALLLPAISSFFQVKIPYSTLIDSRFLWIYILIIVLSGLISLTYPVMNIFKYQPGNMLRGQTISGKSKFSAMKVVVLFQFCISIIMLLIIFVVREQIGFITRVNLGLEDENVLMVELPATERKKAATFRNALQNQAGVVKASMNDFAPEEKDLKNIFRIRKNNQQFDKVFTAFYVDDQYLSSLGIQLKEGRDFNSASAADYTASVIVNEAFVKAAGWQQPINQQVDGPMDAGETDRHARVVGVTKDFYMNSLRSPIEPLVLMLAPEGDGCRYVYVKLTGGNAAAGLRSVETIYKNHFTTAPFQYEFLRERYQSLYAPDRKLATMLAQGTLVVLIITGLGIFGLSALLSANMEKEIGIRKALGCPPGTLYYLHVKRFLRLSVVANLISLPVAGYLVHLWLQEYAYRVSLNAFFFIIAAIGSVIIIILTTSYHAYTISRRKITNSLRVT